MNQCWSQFCTWIYSIYVPLEAKCSIRWNDVSTKEISFSFRCEIFFETRFIYRVLSEVHIENIWKSRNIIQICFWNNKVDFITYLLICRAQKCYASTNRPKEFAKSFKRAVTIKNFCREESSIKMIMPTAIIIKITFFTIQKYTSYIWRTWNCSFSILIIQKKTENVFTKRWI